MRNALKYLLFIALTYLLFVAHSVFGVAADISDGLWQKAVAIATANKNLTPGQMIVTSEELDNQGKVVRSDETWIRYFPGTGNQVESEILKALENEKDVTAERRQKMKEEQAKKEKNSGSNAGKGDSISASPFEEIPFAEDKQGFIHVTRLNSKESISGRYCEVYEYTMTKDKKASYKGKAWLDKDSGIPVQIRYTPNPLPKYVTRMETSIVFATAGNQFFPSEIRLEGAGGFLFIKKNLRMTMKLSDYWVFEKSHE